MTVITRTPHAGSPGSLPREVILSAEFAQEARLLGDPDLMEAAYEDLVQSAGRDSGVPRSNSLPFINEQFNFSDTENTTGAAANAVRQALGEQIVTAANLQETLHATIEVEARVLADMWVKDPHNQAFIGAVATAAAKSYGEWGSSIFAQTFHNTARKGLESGNQDKQTRLRLRALGNMAFIHAENQIIDGGQTDVERMLEGKAAKIIPSFDEVFEDGERDSTFVSIVKGEPARTLTESEGIKELDVFLARAIETIETCGYSAHKKAELMRVATSLRLNLSYLGEREFGEATNGIARMWQTYLDADPDNKICVLTDIGNLDRYNAPKSDAHVLRQVLANIPDSDRGRYGSRLVFGLDELYAGGAPIPKKTKVILLDDWSLSGRQMRDVHNKRVVTDERYRSLFDSGSVEVDLLIATNKQLRDGLTPDMHSNGIVLPVRSYYRARSIPTAADNRGINAHITGLHSTANRGFQDEIETLRRELNMYDIPLPALAQVNSSYKPTAKSKAR